MTQQSATRTSNKQFDLVSILYHSLKAAQSCAVYIQDAQREGDQEMMQFFQQVYQNENACAERAKQLLTRVATGQTQQQDPERMQTAREDAKVSQ